MVLLLSAMTATVVVASGVALAATVTGTDGPDFLEGTPDADLIKALGGNDQLSGLSGSDTYYGGSGRDYVSEYTGLEPYPGGGDGNTGRDVVFGGRGTDQMEAARGNDTIKGGPNTPGDTDFERLFGDTGDDTLEGNRGKDYLDGEQGSDRMFGGKGPDTIDAADEETAGTPDVVDCGPGTDTAWANENDTVDNCENLTRVANPASMGVLDAKAADGAESEGNF
jgi:Ca2+-binding RTX toxin-like protein